MENSLLASEASYVGPLPPTRGIITVHNLYGVSHDLTTLRKWIRLNSAVYKTDRIDVRIDEGERKLWKALSHFADSECVLLSLRIAEGCSYGTVESLLEENVHDICLETTADDIETAEEDLSLFTRHNLPVRVILRATPQLSEKVSHVSNVLKSASAVEIAAFNVFARHVDCINPDKEHAVIAAMNEVARLLRDTSVDIRLTGLPFCLVDIENLPVAFNKRQCFLDHLQYYWNSLEFAERMYRFGSRRLSAAIENLLARKTSVHNLIDAALFPWIQDYPRFYIRVWMFHKLTRRLRFFIPKPRPLPETSEEMDEALVWYSREVMKRSGRICGPCKYRLVCDHLSHTFARHFPNTAISTVSGEPIPATCASVSTRKRYYDAIDQKRLHLPERLLKLADTTRETILRMTPTREISADTYDIEGRYTHHMPGAVRWLSFGAGEMESTVLDRLKPPFVLSYTIGGGIASHAGFSFGRYAKIVCPMVDYSHRLALGVDKDGFYVLLRDGQVVRPTEFEPGTHVPPKLGGVLEPRINLHNVDGMILTQTVLLWEGEQEPCKKIPTVKYSVVIISTRYTRRLQAALLSLAHQQGIENGLFEVVVGYVPGIDATDDLLDSIEASFPHLSVVRLPFAEGKIKAKGFMINESLSACSGKWILLMDADILLPPDTFTLLESIADNRHFIAPEGRKMLSPELTAKILLNEIRPWENYQELLQGPGEIRKREADGTPIGFFQCVRREILSRIPYHELDHFEASDWHFGRDVVMNYGWEYRIKDWYVLHLDHGGSQWYGTHKHR